MKVFVCVSLLLASVYGHVLFDYPMERDMKLDPYSQSGREDGPIKIKISDVPLIERIHPSQIARPDNPYEQLYGWAIKRSSGNNGWISKESLRKAIEHGDMEKVMKYILQHN